MEFTGFYIQFVPTIIQVKYLIGSIGLVLQKKSQLNSALCFWFVARLEAPVTC